MPRPSNNDFAPFYASYVSSVEGDDIFKVLVKQSQDTQKILNCFPRHKGNFAYAEGKWTVKQVIGHLMDTERIFAYRALCIARGEKQSLPGFNQDAYVDEGMFNNRELFDLTYEFRLLRESNLLLFKSFTENMLSKRGVANNYDVTVLALLYIIAGHEKHHMKILEERYL
ncbi:MAG: DinB family protein [Ignavibacteriaceae bacterium]|nr:DinB family protein [Ignavibacteriaceae bacterium]